MLDLLLIATLGFLGSFGHCMGMCGPLSIAFALSQQDRNPKEFRGWQFHLLLNLGRIISYSLVGAALGSLGSIVVASGQLAGIGSFFRQFMAIFTGLLLVWFGIGQLKPNWLPRLPFLNPFKGKIHDRLNAGMNRLASFQGWWSPILLGSVWGLIPCGFLYAAQLKAVETGNLWGGMATLLCFGLGTMPVMWGLGVSVSQISADRRSQLFRLGGWVTLSIGILTLSRNDAMVDYTGHLAVALLLVALIARPLSPLFPQIIKYRRAIGVAAFVLSLAHSAYMLDHSLNWNLDAIAFMLPQHRIGISMGILSLFLLFPAAITSSDRWQKKLGQRWRKIHLLSVPAMMFAVAHVVLSGSHYLGNLEANLLGQLRTGLVIFLGILVLLARSRTTVK